jgi:AbrB family looped-hinge helix DNA binding protein
MGMRITSKGQVTIPKDVRDDLGLRAGDEVDFVVDQATHTAHLVKVELSEDLLKGRRSRGHRLVSAVAGSATANLDLTTDEIMAMLRGHPAEDGDG